MNTAISPTQLNDIVVSPEMGWPLEGTILIAVLDDSSFNSGVCSIVIEGDYGQGFTFIASANQILAGSKAKDGSPPGMSIDQDHANTGFGLIPTKVRFSLIPDEGSPVVGLLTNAEVLP